MSYQDNSKEGKTEFMLDVALRRMHNHIYLKSSLDYKHTVHFKGFILLNLLGRANNMVLANKYSEAAKEFHNGIYASKLLLEYWSDEIDVNLLVLKDRLNEIGGIFHADRLDSKFHWAYNRVK